MARLALVLLVLLPLSSRAQAPDVAAPEVAAPDVAIPDTSLPDAAEVESPEEPPVMDAPEPPPLMLTNDAPPSRPQLGEAWSSQLGNGLRVVGRHDPRRSTAAVCVSYRVGTRDDPSGYTGLAHLTEHMMFATMERMPRGMGGLLESAGAVYVNASTGSDETRYCEGLPDSALDLALFGEAERMAYLLASLSEAQVATQRRVVLNEGLERGRGGPAERLMRLDMEALYPRGHVRLRGDRSERDVGELRLRHVQWFHQRYYGPGNAVLAIVSPRPQAEVMERVREYFARVRGAAPPTPRSSESVTLDAPVRIDFDSRLLNQGLRLTWPTPRLREGDDAALDFVAMRLWTLLDEELLDFRLLSVSARQFSARDGSEFRIMATAAPQVNLDRLLVAIDRAVARVQTELPDAHEFASLRATLMAHRADDPLSRASSLASSALYDDAPWTEERERARYESVTAEDLRAAALRHLPLDRRIMVFNTHDPDVPLEGRVYVNRGGR